MKLTSRDRKIVLLVIPVALILAFWFLLLSPKREEAARAGDDLAKQEQRRDAAVAKLAGLETSRRSFAADYAAVVRLGKAAPTSLDVASLMVQLDRAAIDATVDFSSVKAGAGEDASASAPPSAGAGGAGAATPPGGAGGGGSPAGGATPAKGLETVPFQFIFQGSFFRLADFFHQTKRFVYLTDGEVQVHGRLVIIEGFKLTTEQNQPGVKAEITSNVYLTPKSQGPTGGASAAGPSTQPTGSSPDPSSGSTPTAAATP